MSGAIFVIGGLGVFSGGKFILGPRPAGRTTADDGVRAPLKRVRVPLKGI